MMTDGTVTALAPVAARRSDPDPDPWPGGFAVSWDLTQTDPDTPVPAALWHYSWTVTLIWRRPADSPSGTATSAQLLIDDVDELHRILERTNFDPRVADVRYERHAELNMLAAPVNCYSCAEPFAETRPRQWWRVCTCGGHWVFACVVCGDSQLYPRIDSGCG